MTQWGLKKPCAWVTLFSVFSTIHAKRMTMLFQALLPWFLRGYTIAKLHDNHCPWASPAHVAWPLALLLLLQGSGRQIFMLRVKTLSARDCNRGKSREKKRYRELQCKSICFSALTGLVPRKMVKGQQRLPESFSTLRQDLNFEVKFEPMSPYSLKDCYCPQVVVGKQFLLARLSFSDCSSWISRPDKIHHNSCLQTFVDTCDCIGHRLKKGSLLTHFLPNARWTAHRPQKSEKCELEI